METEFKPNWVSPPGDTIRDILREQNKDPEVYLTWALETSIQEVYDLLDGRTAITTHIARVLEKSVGGSAGFWLQRDNIYRQDKQRLGL